MGLYANHRDSFLADMRRMGFDDPLLEGEYDAVQLSKMGKSTMLYTDFGEDRMLYRLDLELDENKRPFFNGFKATLIKTHPIVHGVFSGVNTRELEEQLKKGGWNTDMDILSDLFGRIMTLTTSTCEQAKDIAQRLQARYWLGTTLSNQLNLDRLHSQFGYSHYFLLAGKMGKVTANQAYNLLSGRPVLRLDFFGHGLRPEMFVGLRLKGREFEELKYDGFDIGAKLLEINLKEVKSEESGLELIDRLRDGDCAPATLIRLGIEIPVYLSVDADRKCLLMFDADGQRLYINASAQRDRIAKERSEKIASSTRKKGNGNGL